MKKEMMENATGVKLTKKASKNVSDRYRSDWQQ